MNYRCIPFFLILASFFLFVTDVVAFTIQKPNTNNIGLVAHWTFDGKNVTNGRIDDVSGQGNNGNTVNIASSTFYTIGKIGQGVKFDGVDDRISAGDISSTESQSKLSWSVWVYDSFTSDVGGCLICKNDPINQTQSSWALKRTPFSWNSTRNDVTLFVANALTDNDLGDTFCSTSGNPLVSNQWNHIVAIFDGTLTGNTNRVKIYVNGVQATIGEGDCSDTIPASTLNSTTVVTLGDAGAGHRLFPGKIDEARIYNRAIEAAEVRALYNQGAATKINFPSNRNTDGLIGHWTFDGKDVPNGRANDVSGLGNHGNLVSISTSTFYALGKIGQGFNFDGADDHINIPDNSSLHATKGTISAWVKTTSDTDMSIFGASQSSSLSNSFSLELGPSTGFCTNELVSVHVNNSIKMCYTTANRSEVFDGNWHHIAATVDGTTSIYLDGVSKTVTVGQGDDTGIFTSSGSINRFRIGNLVSSGSDINQFNGTIDDVRMYNRALTATEIKQLYSNGATAQRIKTLTNRGLVTRYYLDEFLSGDGDGTVLDASAIFTGSTYDLTIIDDLADNFKYIRVNGNDGMDNRATEGVQRIYKNINDTADKVRTMINGIQKGTFELVVRVDACASGGARIFGINGRAGQNGEFIIKCTATNSWRLAWNDSDRDTWDGGTNLAVFHVVVDTTQGNQNDRIKVYRNGVAITSTVSSEITQNETLSLGASQDLIMFNRENAGTFGRSFDGILFYAAMYAVDLTPQEVLNNYSILKVNDDRY